MQALSFLGALIVAGVGQKLNADPRVPTPLVKLAMALIGIGLYLVKSQPAAWHGQAFLDWLDEAWLWAVAVPGLASLIGLAPGMATKTAAIVGLTFLLWAGPTQAQEAPAAHVLGVAVGGNGVWYDGTSLANKSDIEGAVNGRASLSPHISIVASGAYGARNHYWRYTAGGRVTVSDGRDPGLSVGVGIQYRGSGEARLKPDEWAPDVSIGWRPWTDAPALVLVGQGWYGLTSQAGGAYVGARYALPI